jgi:hypothetical protein
MADLVPVAASVLKAAASTINTVTAGETITAGMAVYKDTADSNEYKKAIDSSAAAALAAGIALTGSSDGQPLVICTVGGIDLGCVLTVGETYVVSDTAGGIAPVADIGSGDFVTILGVATTAGNLALDIQASGIAKP